MRADAKQGHRDAFRSRARRLPPKNRIDATRPADIQPPAHPLSGKQRRSWWTGKSELVVVLSAISSHSRPAGFG
jgi:hypothetical protein